MDHRFLPNGALVKFFSDGAVFVPSPVTSNDPNPRPLGDGFFDDITRGYTQKAAYASIDVELIPKTLTLTAGTRYSRTNTSEVGSTVDGLGCRLLVGPPVPNPCVNHSTVFFNIDAEHLDKTYSGFKSRANLSWQVTEDALLYYTWSQGFRAGGFNRAPIAPADDSPLAANGHENQAQADQHGGYVASVDFAPDTLTNNELGWKTQWMDRRIQWNGALYQEDWNHTQIGLYGNFYASLNIQRNRQWWRLQGARPGELGRGSCRGRSHDRSGRRLESQRVGQAGDISVEGRNTNRLQRATDLDRTEAFESGGALGSPLAGAPPFQGNIRALRVYV